MAIYDQVMISAPYGAVFSDGPPTFEYFKRIVRSLSRTDTLFWCARLNLILADPNLDNRAKQQQFLDMFFTSQQIDSLNKFAEERGGSQRVGVVHRGTLLELIRWACLLCPEHPDDGETFNKPETLDAFARALLMANDFWAERVYRATFFKGTTIDEKRRNSLVRFDTLWVKRAAIPDNSKLSPVASSSSKGFFPNTIPISPKSSLRARACGLTSTICVFARLWCTI